MIFDVITLFPELVDNVLSHSIIGRSIEKKIIQVNAHQLRNWGISGSSKKKIVDDEPYSGGGGMLLKPEPIYDAVSSLKKKNSVVILMTPHGELLNQNLLFDIIKNNNIKKKSDSISSKSKKKEDQNQLHFIIICGHYEGVDHRIVDLIVDREISIGDYILTNGALAAAIFIDSLARLLPGVLNNNESLSGESFSDNLLSSPQYTRPRSFMGKNVPEILLSGNHEEIKKWKMEISKKITKEKRPDLLE